MSNGTSTVRYNEPGKLLTAALPLREIPWVRVTAVGTDDASPRAIAITDLSVTPIRRFRVRAHPVNLHHTWWFPAAEQSHCRGTGIWAPNFTH